MGKDSESQFRKSEGTLLAVRNSEKKWRYNNSHDFSKNLCVRLKLVPIELGL